MILLYTIMKNVKSKFFFDNENTEAFFTMAKYSIGSEIEFFYSDIIENEFIFDQDDEETSRNEPLRKAVVV